MLLKDETYSISNSKQSIQSQIFLPTHPIFIFSLVGVSAPQTSISALLTRDRKGGDNARLTWLLFGGWAGVDIGREDNKAWISEQLFGTQNSYPLGSLPSGGMRCRLHCIHNFRVYLKEFKNGAFRVIKYHHDLVDPCQEGKASISISYQEQDGFWSHFTDFEDGVALLRTSITITIAATARTLLTKDHSA